MGAMAWRSTATIFATSDFSGAEPEPVTVLKLRSHLEGLFDFCVLNDDFYIPCSQWMSVLTLVFTAGKH